MKIKRPIIVSILTIIGLVLITEHTFGVYNKCITYFHRKTFLSKYEIENFSLFNGIDIFIRGRDIERSPIVMVNASYLINDTLKVGLYVVTLNKETYTVTKAKWMVEHHVDADTTKLQQLAQAFMKYEIPRMNVDIHGNVFVYLKDFETLALARFVSESEMHQNPRKWINIKSNWYKPQ